MNLVSAGAKRVESFLKKMVEDQIYVRYAGIPETAKEFKIVQDLKIYIQTPQD